MPLGEGRHTWSVESLHEGIARIEEDGTRMLSLPVHLLPPDVAEGQILRVTRRAAPDARSMELAIAIDFAATATALKASAVRTTQAAAESRNRDAGGDVTL